MVLFTLLLCSSTLAQDYDKFWVGVTSSPLKIVADDQELKNSISTTRQPLKPTYSYTGKPNAENRYVYCFLFFFFILYGY